MFSKPEPVSLEAVSLIVTHVCCMSARGPVGGGYGGVMSVNKLKQQSGVKRAAL